MDLVTHCTVHSVTGRMGGSGKVEGITMFKVHFSYIRVRESGFGGFIFQSSAHRLGGGGAILQTNISPFQKKKISLFLCCFIIVTMFQTP